MRKSTGELARLDWMKPSCTSAGRQGALAEDEDTGESEQLQT